jgi:hypothetical protein
MQHAPGKPGPAAGGQPTANAFARAVLAADRAGARVPLEPTIVGSSGLAVRGALAQRRERVRRSAAGGAAPCEQCGREWCAPGDFLGPRCRGTRGAP